MQDLDLEQVIKSQNSQNNAELPCNFVISQSNICGGIEFSDLSPT